MRPIDGTRRTYDRRSLVLAVVAILAGLIVVRDRAGSWYDLSRLATVESLVDRQTWWIDDSIFHQPRLHPDPNSFLDRNVAENLIDGTKDKLWINEHFYSDKSPVPALIMAVGYRSIQSITGLRAIDHPRTFVLWMIFLSAVIPFAIAVVCMDRVFRRFSTTPAINNLLTLSFALGSVALTYTESVNNHILMLAVCSMICQTVTQSSRSLFAILRLGLLVGMGYAIDQGGALPLLLATSIWFLLRHPQFRPIAYFIVGALPLIVLHHALNFMIGGTLAPANANPEYLAWPGSPFNTSTMTGVLHHESIGGFLIYAFDLLVGKKGFLGHNLALYIVPMAIVLLFRVRSKFRPELLFALILSVGTWMMYSMFSNNWAGMCCSIRWFVPLLAPGYLIIAIFLQRFPEWTWSFSVLAAWGFVLGVLMVWAGPWTMRMIPLYWPIQVACLLTWCVVGVRRKSNSIPNTFKLQETAA